MPKKKKNRFGTVFVSKATNPRFSSFSYTLENLIYDPVILFVPAELVSYLSAVRDVITNFANTLYKIQRIDARIEENLVIYALRYENDVMHRIKGCFAYFELEKSTRYHFSIQFISPYLWH